MPLRPNRQEMEQSPIRNAWTACHRLIGDVKRTDRSLLHGFSDVVTCFLTTTSRSPRPRTMLPPCWFRDVISGEGYWKDFPLLANPPSRAWRRRICSWITGQQGDS